MCGSEMTEDVRSLGRAFVDAREAYQRAVDRAGGGALRPRLASGKRSGNVRM